MIGRLACAVAIAAIGLSILPAASEPLPASASDQIMIRYVEPANPAHRPIYERLQKRGVLEDLQKFLSPLRLPQPLTIKIEGCNGIVNAWYSARTVSICYEYIAWIHQIARKITITENISVEDAVVGPFVTVLLHELSHAIFDMLNIPIFGKEEDAADQLAAFVLLQFGNDVARRTITGSALLFHQMGIDQEPGAADYASVHGLPRQRFVNVLCIAYGKEPRLFADFVQKGHLPENRIRHCRWEYRQIARAYRTLIGPHVDQELQEQVIKERWLRPDDGKQ